MLPTRSENIVNVILRMAEDLGELKGAAIETREVLAQQSREIREIRGTMACGLHTEQLKELAITATSWREYLIKQRSVFMVLKKAIGALVIAVTLIGSLSACFFSWRSSKASTQISHRQDVQDTYNKDHGKNTAKALP
jgi:hypothetical protein